jgi:general secretion pathway protein G
MLSAFKPHTAHCRTRRASTRTAFTLIELLLVLAILVVLASMVITMYSGTQERAFKDAAKGQIGIFKSGINLYKFHTRNYPQGLDNLINKPGDATIAERWAGPYMDATKIPQDPWDHEYKFVAPGKHNRDTFDVWSMGPDGQDGTADDIGNWET